MKMNTKNEHDGDDDDDDDDDEEEEDEDEEEEEEEGQEHEEQQPRLATSFATVRANERSNSSQHGDRGESRQGDPIRILSPKIQEP